MKKKYRKLNLLPFYFRNIGLGIIVILLLLILLGSSEWYQPEYKGLLEAGLLVGLLLIAISKGRVEDERTLEIRTRIYSGTFIMGVVYLIVSKIFSYWGVFGTGKEISAFQLLFSMFIFYFVFSFFVKRRG